MDPLSEAILLHDLHMHTLAVHFDLRNKVGRKQSVAALADLFFDLSVAAAPALFIEAGAKNGAVAARARRRVPGARVVAFEANPEIHARYRDAVPFGVEYLHLALADAPGNLPFLIQSGVTGGQHSLLPRVERADYRTVTVEATSLDSFFPDAPPCCLWIDVEGATGQVLSGARGVLRRTAALIVEVEDRPVWAGQWLRPRVSAFLLEAGLLPIARDFQSRYQYNVVFASESLISEPRARNAIANFYSSIGTGRPTHPSWFAEFRARLKRIWRWQPR